MPHSESVAAAVSRIQQCAREHWLADLRSDQAARWRSGQPVLVEEYLRCWPELTGDEEDTLVLICGEFRLRREMGQPATLEEHQARFPQFGPQLRIQFQLDQLLSKSLADEEAAIVCPCCHNSLGGSERLWRWCRRKPALASLTAAVAMLLVAIAVGGTIAAFQFRSQAQEAEENLYFNRISNTHHELTFDNLRRAQELLDACPEPLRGWEWGYLQRRCWFEPTVFQGPERGIYSVAFSGDGAKLAAAGEDGSIRVFDLTTGAIQTINAHSKFVFSIAFHPDGRHLASAGADKTVKLWDLSTERPVFEKVGHAGDYAGAAYALAFSPDGQRLALGSDKETISVCDVASGNTLFELRGHKRFVSAVAFHPDGTLLATGGFDGELQIWDATSGTNLHRFARARDKPIDTVGFSPPDGRLLATGGFDRLIKIWDTTTWQVVQTLSGHYGLVTGLAFSPDGQRLASNGKDKTVRLWHPLTGREILALREHTFGGGAVAFNRHGLLASCGLDGTARVYDPRPSEGERIESLALEHDHEVWDVAFSPEGRQLASGGWDKTVRLWDPMTGKRQHTLTHPGDVMSIAYSSDGKHLAANGGSTGPMSAGITVWDPVTGHERGSPIEGVGLKFGVTFSPDSRYLLAEDRFQTIGVWDVQTREYVGNFGKPDQQLWCFQFSPDGGRLATSSNDYRVKVWPWHADRFQEVKKPLLELREERLNGFSDRATFSSDGTRLITAGEGHTVKIWDATSGDLLLTLSGHTGDVFALAVSADGRWLASGGRDTTIRLWDAETGEARYKLRGHIGGISSLAFSADSRLLASGCRDNTVKVWQLDRIVAREVSVNVAGNQPARPSRSRVAG